MTSIATFSGMAQTLTEARAKRDAAAQAVQDDKTKRAGSLIARLIDACVRTKPESALRKAEADLADLSLHIEKATETMVSILTKARISEDPEAQMIHKAHSDRRDALAVRRDEVGTWLGLANTAHHRLSEAKEACESASTMEMFDLVSSNKGIAFLSSMETSEAADTVKDAERAVRALSEALPKRAKGEDLGAPDDFTDLIFDMAFAPAIDIFSWFNMQKLDEAADRCEQTLHDLAPLREKLAALHARAEARVDAENAALREIEAPFRAAVWAEVPEVLRPAEETFSPAP